MSTDNNVAIVRRLFEAETRGDVDVIDELVASECEAHPLWHQPFMPAHLPPATSPAPERWKRWLPGSASCFLTGRPRSKRS